MGEEVEIDKLNDKDTNLGQQPKESTVFPLHQHSLTFALA